MAITKRQFRSSNARLIGPEAEGIAQSTTTGIQRLLVCRTSHGAHTHAVRVYAHDFGGTRGTEWFIGPACPTTRGHASSWNIQVATNAEEQVTCTLCRAYFGKES